MLFVFRRILRIIINANYYKDINAGNEFDADTLNSSHRYKNTFISVGLENNFITKKVFQAYYGTDLRLFIAEASGNYISQTGITSFASEKMQAGIGISPFVGVRLQLKRLAFSLEPSVDLLIFKENDKRNYVAPEPKRQSFSTFNFNLRPNIVNRLVVSFVF